VKVDRMSMAHSLEVRAPFLEPALAEFALRLPAQLKTTRCSPSKAVLRELAHRAYGLGIASAPKQGFSIPVHAWLRGAARERMEDLLGWSSLREIPVLDAAAVRRAVEEHLSRRRSHGFELWGLMVLVAWHRGRVQHAPVVPSAAPPESLVLPLECPA
jgi:asparagine synthase (glutamine-hydrolysing)